MKIAFFISSVGDTDLAKATISKVLEKGLSEEIHLIAVTPVANNRIEDLMVSANIKRIKLAEILKQNEIASPQLSKDEVVLVNDYIAQNNIEHVYIGVPSPLEEDIPYQIAENLEIPCIVAYEYMFTAPEKHHFWRHLNLFGNKKNCEFAVPLPMAKSDILQFDEKAKIHTIGHLSIDQAMINKNVDASAIRLKLQVEEKEELAFISGTTQPHEVDDKFMDAILSEIATGKYPHLQIRLGLHPGVKNLDAYLEAILKTCGKYPTTFNQFKIILPTHLEEKLNKAISKEHPFILRANVTGADASATADKIAQAVPGALLNEAAIKGKPSYFHEKSSTPYLPKAYFSQSLSAFFNAKPQPQHSRKDLGLEEETAANKMANLLTR